MARLKLKATFNKLLKKTPARSGNPAEVQLRRIQMGILEMEDVLFHLNSCVMMPEAPAGASSSQGASGTTQAEADREGDQITYTGIRALAMVFRQLEKYPQQSILLAGHTDSSGGYEINYLIAHQRALNVRCLLEGNRTRWAQVSQSRQKVEDHQQILKWLSQNQRLQWATDPGEIDNAWGQKTETALARFVDHYNEHYALTFTAKGDIAEMEGPTRLDPAVVGTVKKHSKHEWPVQLWQAAFDLYYEEMADALDVGVTELPGLRTEHLRWADERNRLVACGESFPIDSAEKNNYRSQKNRRVEILFFDQDEAPTINCPLVVDRAHTSKECPIWHKAHFTPVYLDPYSLEAVPFHLKFLYFDNVHGTFRDLPQGLTIKAYGKDAAELRTRVRYNKGVYTVQLLESELDAELQFGFESKDLYVYTADDSTDAVIKTVDQATFDALSHEEKYKHYDLPTVWMSANQWTRFDNDLTQGDLFQNVMKDKGLKPHGGSTLAADKPLMFSLDDVVLLDTPKGGQGLRDADGFDAAQPLAETSRVKVLQVDPETASLRLYRTAADEAKSCRLTFPKTKVQGKDTILNRVTQLVPFAKIVAFREGFYTIGRRRSGTEAAWRAQGFVVGARVALRDDPDYHVAWDQGDSDTEFSYTGDHVANYFHGLHVEGAHLTSYYVYYVSMNFMLDCRKKWTGGPGSKEPAKAEPKAADLTRFLDQGVYDAMDHWNVKRYWLEEKSERDDSLRIRPMWFFEEKETFSVVEADMPSYDGGVTYTSGSDTRSLNEDEQRDFFTQSHKCVKDARTKARGGKARFLCFVCRDDNYPKEYGRAYAWSIRTSTWAAGVCAKFSKPAPEFATMKLNKSAWKKHAKGVFKSLLPVPEFGHKFGVFTLAHELGHCTGQSDEYIDRGNVVLLRKADNTARATVSIPEYSQFFEPYTMSLNETAMMNHNGAPRLRYLWFAIRYLQKHAGGKLKALPTGSEFTARFQHPDADLRYSRNLSKTTLDPILRRRLPVTSGLGDDHYRVSESPKTRVRLELHYVGEDEASIRHFHAKQKPTNAKDRYQAVLVVRPMLRLRFHETASDQWDNDKAIDLADRLDKGIRSLTGNYRLTGGKGEIQNIFVNFLAGFTSASGKSETNHTIRWYSTAEPEPGKTVVNDGRDIKVGVDVSADDVARRLFDHTGGSWTTTLGFLKTFVDGKLAGESFTLEKI